MKNILVVSNKSDTAHKIRQSFKQSDFIERAESLAFAVNRLSKKHYDSVFIDIEILGQLPGKTDYRDTIKSFKNFNPSIEIIVISSNETIRETVKAVKSGASDYIGDPIDPEEVKFVTKSIREQAIVQSELDYLREEFWQTDVLEIVRTHNETMKKVYDQIKSVAPTKTTVLLYGETGTGKGVLANLIHRHSNRDKGKFIRLHCGAIPDTLLESELFGHEKGAFTGAFKRKLGKFEIAVEGTIFLDEISTITPPAQIKLLQVLQDGSYSRVGGEEMLHANARVIAATNSDLKKESDDGAFRKDLYYRLNVFPIEIPPLRERKEDIPILLDTFIKQFNMSMQMHVQTVHPDVVDAMRSYDWPGNIREMENLMERAFILETSSVLTPECFPAEFFNGSIKSAVMTVDTTLTLSDARRKAVGDFERQFIKELLANNKGRINKSSEAADISTRQFHKLMIKHGIRKEDYKI
jgi:DNA-binding NtrC family response regulator